MKLFALVVIISILAVCLYILGFKGGTDKTRFDSQEGGPT